MTGIVETAGHLPDGREVKRITIRDGALTATLLTYGATIQSIVLDPVEYSLIVGFGTLDPYLQGGGYIGPIVGRVANRIAGGRAEIAGTAHQLEINESKRHMLHGGSEGTARQLWEIEAAGDSAVTLGLVLPDGHMGFPGTLRITATFAIIGGSGLQIDLSSDCDAPTLCNLAPHLYFNLDGGGDARDHILQLDADHVLPTDAENIPTGEIRAVNGTAWDFRTGRTLRDPDGCDHNLCLANSRRTITKIGSLRGAHSGVTMGIETTEPGLQTYDGRGLGPVAGGPYSGIALEPQSWPDAPNHPEFPSIALAPGETLRQISRFVFSLDQETG